MYMIFKKKSDIKIGDLDEKVLKFEHKQPVLKMDFINV
jgi:hypothetical protein